MVTASYQQSARASAASWHANVGTALRRSGLHGCSQGAAGGGRHRAYNPVTHKVQSSAGPIKTSRANPSPSFSFRWALAPRQRAQRTVFVQLRRRCPGSASPTPASASPRSSLQGPAPRRPLLPWPPLRLILCPTRRSLLRAVLRPVSAQRQYSG
jgi:hypothetical protein